MSNHPPKPAPTAVATAPIPPTIRPEHVTPVPAAELATAVGGTLDGGPATAITGVTVSSTNARQGDLFVAIPGRNAHGARYTVEAAAAGAVALLTDAEGASIAAAAFGATGAVALPTIIVDSPRLALGAAGARVYDFTRDRPQLFGITGTNGKTSTVHLLEGIAGALGEVTGLSSTAERHIAGRVVVSGLTTPEASDVHALIATMREADVTVAAIEVSAQALERHRVDGAAA